MKYLAIPSLRWRLVAVMCLAYVVVAVSTEVAGYSVQRANLHSQLDTRAVTDADILAAGSVGSLTSAAASTETLRTFILSLRNEQGLVYAAVIVSDGTVAASTKRTEVGKHKSLPIAVTRPQAVHLSNGRVMGVSPVVASSTELGVVEVILTDTAIQSDLHDTIVVETLVRALGLILFILLSLVISRYILGPLSSLARAARDIRGGVMSTRVPSFGQTELSTVAGAFNDMANALEHRISHLTFLAESGALLPNTFRERGQVGPILREFCEKLDACGACLIYPNADAEDICCSMSPDDSMWPVTARSLAMRVSYPMATLEDGRAVMAVPVLNGVFVTARSNGIAFPIDEQQVITNFAFQVGIASDNARLFTSQQEALKVKDQFLSIVSHELRTPLTTIKGYAQLLNKKLAEDADGRRFSSMIDAQTGRLSRLVDDLLDVTRFSRGQFELTRQRVDLVPILEDIAARFRMTSVRHRIELDTQDTALEGMWDHDRLEQVLTNLLSNAVKYSPEGGTISITARRTSNQVEVSIRDEGIGISEEDQDQLFERFYRASADDYHIQGLGLGLYVTRRIIESHGGTISVESQPNQGSVFTFSLPLLPAPAAQPVEAGSAAQ